MSLSFNLAPPHIQLIHGGKKGRPQPQERGTRVWRVPGDLPDDAGPPIRGPGTVPLVRQG